MLIIWDRMFGTFVEESPKRKCIYGLDARQRPLGTFNPLWHQLQHLACTLRLAFAKVGRVSTVGQTASLP